MEADAPEWVIDAIVSEWMQRRVSMAAGLRMLAIVQEQPLLNEGMGTQTETARVVRAIAGLDNETNTHNDGKDD